MKIKKGKKDKEIKKNRERKEIIRRSRKAKKS